MFSLSNGQVPVPSLPSLSYAVPFSFSPMPNMYNSQFILSLQYLMPFRTLSPTPSILTTLSLSFLHFLHTQHSYHHSFLPLLPPSACAVGGGCGGSVVGARLAEAGWQVLVIEAGPPPTPETTVPGLSVALYFTDTNWEYYIAPQRYSNGYFMGKVSLSAASINSCRRSESVSHSLNLLVS